MLTKSHPTCAPRPTLPLCFGTGDGAWGPEGCSLCWDKHLGRRSHVLSWVNSSVVETGWLRDSPEILCRAERGRNKTQALSMVTFHFEPSLSGASSSKLLFGGWGGCSSPRTGNVPGGFQRAVNPLLGIRQLGVVCQQHSLDVGGVPAGCSAVLGCECFGKGLVLWEEGREAVPRACDGHRPCCSVIF